MGIKEYFEREDIRAQAKKDLCEIVAIPSVASSADGIYPYGKECARAVDKAKEIAERYGFKCENHEYHCLSVLFGDSEKEVGIVAHLDVVPAGEGWTFDPYTLVEKDGLLIGRGAHDDKGPFIQALYTMRYFKENGIKLPFTIRLILGSDEEVGSSDLAYFRKVRKPPMFSFTPDSEFPVCIGEKSILGVNVDLGELPENVIDIHGGTVSNAVAGRAYAKIKGKVSFKDTEFVKAEADGNDTLIKAIGKTAHAAMPEAGVSAIKLLVDALIENKIVSGDRFDFISKATAEHKGETLGIAAENEDFGYLTCVGGVLQVKGGKLLQNFNIRYLPESDYKDLVKNIEASVAPFGGKVSLTSQSTGYHVSADDEKIKALTKACEDVVGYECKPYTMGGGTYARSLPNTVAFGSGVLEERNHLGDEHGNAHQTDEYISVKEFFMGMEIYSRALDNLSAIL